MQPQVILASSSPRRHQLLRYLVDPFIIDPSTIDETPSPGIAPPDLARSLAERKARDVARRHPDAIVIGADTLVDLHGQILNKPENAAEAARMLRALSGTKHLVHTGIAVWRADQMHSRVVSAGVAMRTVTDEAIATYVAGGEPLDKAGAYAAQGEGAAFIERVDGSYLAVVGLPLAALQELLMEAGIAVHANTTLLARLEAGEQIPNSPDFNPPT